MKVVVTGGGTGGHIYPALAFAQFAEDNYNAEILYIGNESRMESEVVPATGRAFFGIQMQGMNRKNMFKNIGIPLKTYAAYKSVKQQLNVFQPDIVIGTGGYVTVPVLLAARKIAKKTAVFEPDMNPGKANSFLSSRVDTVLTSFAEACEKYSKAKKVVHLGNPITLNYRPLTADVQFQKKQLTFLGGSLGAECLNQLAEAAAQDKRFNDFKIVVVTGTRFFEEVKQKLAPYKNVTVRAYESDISKLYEDTTLLISRSGASTVSEVMHKALPTIFIPSPHVANNEQFDNVQVLLKNQACLVFEEHMLKTETFLEAAYLYMTNQEKYDIMNQQLIKQVKNNKMNDILTQIFSEVRV